MKKIIKFSQIAAIVMMAASIFSCRGITPDKKKVDDKPVVITGNRDVCNTQTAADVQLAVISENPLIGNWSNLDRSEDKVIRTTNSLEIKKSQGEVENGLEVTLNQSCILIAVNRGLNVSATATAFDLVTDKKTSLVFQNGSTKTKSERFGSTDVNCAANLESGTYDYSFDGSCLVIAGQYYLKSK